MLDRTRVRLREKPERLDRPEDDEEDEEEEEEEELELVEEPVRDQRALLVPDKWSVWSLEGSESLLELELEESLSPKKALRRAIVSP